MKNKTVSDIAILRYATENKVYRPQPKSKPRLLPDNINIKEEYQLILTKESKLNRTQRDAILDYYNSPIYKRFWYSLVALKYIIQNYKLQRKN